MEGMIAEQAATYGIFALLFVFLLGYVLKTSGEREKRLLSALEKLAEKFNVLNEMSKCLARVEQKIDGRKEP